MRQGNQNTSRNIKNTTLSDDVLIAFDFNSDTFFNQFWEQILFSTRIVEQIFNSLGLGFQWSYFYCLLEINWTLTSEFISRRCLLIAVVLWPLCCHTGLPCCRHRTWHPTPSQYTYMGPTYCVIHWCGSYFE